jgi:hypothetical protein
VTGRMPNGACVRGPNAWIAWQAAHDVLRERLRQLEVDPCVHRDVVRGFRNTIADLEMAAAEYREWERARAATDSAEVPTSAVRAVLDRPSRWMDTGSVAASLDCSERWVTQLCLTGRLAATKQSRAWLIDPGSVRDYLQRGVDAA